MATDPSPMSSGPSGPRASFGQRLGAAIVDWLIFLPVSFVVNLALGRTVGPMVMILIGIGYFTYLEGSPSGQTIGKRVVKIRVLDARSNEPIDYMRAFIRYVGKIISSIPCFLGFFWMLWDDEKQTWHDKISTTIVAPQEVFPVENWPG